MIIIGVGLKVYCVCVSERCLLFSLLLRPARPARAWACEGKLRGRSQARDLFHTSTSTVRFYVCPVYGQIVGSIIDTLFTLLWLMADADLL